MKMIYRENGKWKLCPKKVKYKNKDEEVVEEYTNNPIWFKNFAKKWEYFEVLEITDAGHTNKQKARIKKVKRMSEGHGEAVELYVKTGNFPEGYDLAELLRTGQVKSNIIPEKYMDKDGELQQ